ncbi:TorF family putative porin [Ideonella sp.]|uniref:TorF family putative porin n=1 Tax=Ideonella sp. TaxID=1929293 RepID=UPI002B48D26B|nr:TorF family putative porin [Ideonella sp.]HJV70928.1 TorF family putative porin [Ideonella sp.]
MTKIRALIAAALCAGAFAPSLALAADTSLAFNAGVVSDYRYRGISQTRLHPAVQAGVDLGLPAGLYLGAWGSQIKWIDDAGGNADVELDVYGGWKGEVYKGLTLDVGALTYQYPGNDLHPSANTTEVYGALTYDIVTAKYSQSLTNLFGFADSKSSWYLEIAATLEGPYGISITPHAGHQRVENTPAASYNDYSLTFSKDFNGLVPSVAFVGTSTPNYVAPNGKDLGKSSMVVGVKYNF